MQVISSPRRPGGRLGLALAGGGPEGAIYEIGVLRALDDALDGVDFNDVPVTVGVSAGALVGACLANGISTAQMARSVVHEEPGEHPFRPDLFLRPAAREIGRRMMSVPGLLAGSLADTARRPRTYGLLATLIERLSRAVPVGLFDNAPLRDFLVRVFAAPGRTDDFRQLANELIVVAADLDAGQTVRFGDEEHADVPISLAIQASTALPGLYPPVEIDGRHYVDGVLHKTVHASVALDRGAELVICVNPIVPVDTARSVEQGVMERGKLVDRGLPTVMSQTLRTLIHSRLGTGLAAYEDRYDKADVVLFEPTPDDYTMFFVNVFSFSERKMVLEHAYASTLRQLSKRRDEVGPVFERHGITLREDVLDAPPDVWESVALGRRKRRARRGRAVMPSTVATRDLRDTLGELDTLLN
ncbi:MAG TPA: patatin family protein [Bacteroidetes bacterium]|nr:patatin family protein [Bacteroidota bacterium]HIL57776.1 patatin family protein [Rhodothermales bacterium]